ncbi:uncharacterized protein F4812DRAFT_432589 [Daldinia caldariorum]|uniref:uncharacterized protein n=1 Tax=Daldinia caldariorum TaxID=326644 RepID=UPI002007A2D7|nr:uncharacterized protein F4812DRAFT_432589 [Daldinia caldariorum]KAI1466729.1 hypothetical protein F4812DRAFT_432589 [Daldinia caldariorum]
MSPVLVSQCRRAANRRIRSQNDSIWIPDALLAAVFDRYCMNSRTIVRYGSSVPGPMENRRRMGKRHMGELNLGQMRSGSPLWGLENLADLTQWHWKPPLLPHERLQQRRDARARERPFVRTMLNWFSQTAIEEAGTQLSPNMGWDAQTLPTQIVDAGLDLVFRDLVSMETAATRPNFKKFCHSWRNYLAGSPYSGDTIRTVLDGIQQGINTSRTGTEQSFEWTMDRIKLELLDATVAGLSNHGVDEQSRFNDLIWCDILQRISELTINTVRLFRKAMDYIPENHLNDVSTGVLANIRTFLIASSLHTDRSSISRQANKMAASLRKLNSTDHLHILEDGTKHLLMLRKTTNLYFPRIRMGWLQLLARLPSVDDGYLAKTACILEAGKRVKSLSNREICEMYLAMHRSSLKCRDRMYNCVQKYNVEDSEAYGHFGMELWETDQFGLAKGFCKFLYKLGREQDVMKFAKGARIFIKCEASPLANIAIGVGDPVLAINILNLYRESRVDEKRMGAPRGSSYTSLATATLITLSKNRSFRPYKILSALRVKQLPGKHVQGPLRFPTIRQLRKATIAATRAAMTFAILENISSKQSFTFISNCITYLQKKRGLVVTEPALRALLHNITRDLAEGKPGRITRLRWFLSLADRHIGRDRMLKLGLALKEWRRINAWRRRMDAG